ncbi:MAG TPA: DNA primase [Candidatus Saccharimonadales bacterium]|nr:DNA primase [Candidatus Saccharimonadales bacterium]
MDAVEDIKSRLSIEDVVGQYVELKRAGRNFKGLSPFSSERTPSFMVSPEKQIWHDFSSGKGGNMFSFVMEMEGLDFKGALELLARKAGVDLDQYRTSRRSNSKEKERLHEALELAAKFYQAQLKNSPRAVEYISKKRKFSRATVLEWRLGYSPNTGTALIDFLRKKGFSEAEIKSAGLSAQRYKGPGDMFRGRLMIPLADPQGRIIGFTARILEDDPSAPKYINTPQTLLYDKSQHVFGLHLAKEAIRKHKYVVLVEGNLDVISPHQAGTRQVVATAGTALTERHLKALSRFTGDIRLCFDADKAGLNATERAIPIASKVGVSLSIVTLPSGKDPDELVKKDPGLWEEIIEKPQYALDWLIDRYKTLLDLTSAQGKRQFSDIILQVVRGLTDQVEQEHYIGAVAQLIGVSKDALIAKLEAPQAAPRLKSKRTENRPLDKTQVDMIKTENHLLALALLQPKLREFIAPLKPGMLAEPQAAELLQFLQDNPDFAGEPDKVAALKQLADYVKIVGIIYEELYQSLEHTELHFEAARLQAHLVDQYVKTQKARIAHELQASNDARTAELLAAVKRLDQLLKTHKGGGNSAQETS